jgi:ribonucleotide monophosphatase NagD (HAD superfamily)
VFGGRCPVRDLGWGTPAAPIAAVLVLADPRGDAWYQDLQLALDVVTSHGVVLEAASGTGERSGSGSGGSSSNSSSNGSGLPPPGSAPVPVYFSNPDVLWANECPRPRLGQGAFAAALGALHREVAGGPLPRVHFYGKPHAPQYRLAERLLLRQAAAATTTSGSDVAHGEGDDDEAALRARVKSTFSAIWAVGDNPAADVRGANTAGAPWVSVLVRTGVFQGGANSRSDPAALVVDDVDAAVTAALHRSREAKWHSMR